MKATNTEIIRLLGEIVQGTSLAQTVARNLETTILEAYPEADDDERFENVLHMLASFEPHGREYMYDEEQLRQECKLLLAKLSG